MSRILVGLRKGAPVVVGRPGAPAPPGPPRLVAEGGRVRFRHPSGESRTGTVRTVGQKGATIADDQDGAVHSVPHEHLQPEVPAVPSPGGPGKPPAGPGSPPRPPGAPSAAPAPPGAPGMPPQPGWPGTMPHAPGAPDPMEGQRKTAEKLKDEADLRELAETATDLPRMMREARADLRMGLTSEAAHRAAAALLVAHTGRPIGDLHIGNFKIDGDEIKVHGQTFDDPDLASFLRRSFVDRPAESPAFGRTDRGVSDRDVDAFLLDMGDGLTLDKIRKLIASQKWAATAADASPHADPKRISKAAEVDPDDVHPAVQEAHHGGLRYDGGDFAKHLRRVGEHGRGDGHPTDPTAPDPGGGVPPG